ncbi:hypothetical protein H4R35_006103 [Dimargaris xerosporica]|nr:hypothetical protein H4R35_006103 [Dimargaris xerosporica]
MPTSPAKTGARRNQPHGATATPDKSRTEAFLDSLRTESGRDSDSDSVSGTNSQPDEDDDEDEDDSSCAVCGGQDATKRNEILFCDGKDCDMPVHQKCYDIKTIPPDDVSWFCQRCEDKVPAAKARIVCCDSDSGALKRTDRPREYVHVVCGLWNPRIDTDNPTQWQVPVQSEAATAPCELCKSTNGLAVKCCYADEDQEKDSDFDPLSDGCHRHFHVTCAIEHGLVVVSSPPLAATQQLLCSDHKRLRRSSRRGRPRTRLIKDSPSVSKPEVVSPVVKKRKLMRKSNTPSAETTPSSAESPRRRKGLIPLEDDEDHANQPVNPVRGTPTPPSPSTRSLSAMAVDPSPALSPPGAIPTNATPLPSASSAPGPFSSAPKVAVPGLAITTHPVSTPTTKHSPLNTGAGVPSTPPRSPLVRPPVRPRPARRPISTGMSSLGPTPNPLGETTMLSGSLPGPAAKTSEPTTDTAKAKSPRRGASSATSKKPSFLRASAPIHAPTVTEASPPPKKGTKPLGAASMASGTPVANSPKTQQTSQTALVDKPLISSPLEAPSTQPNSVPTATTNIASAGQPPSADLLEQDTTANKSTALPPKPLGSVDLRRSTLQSNASSYTLLESSSARSLTSIGPTRDPPSTLFPRSQSRSRSPHRTRTPNDRSGHEREPTDAYVQSGHEREPTDAYVQGSGDGGGRDEYRSESRPNRSRGSPRERRPERSSDRSYGRSYERENGEWGPDYYRPREWAHDRERARLNGHDMDSNGIAPVASHSAAAGRDRVRDEWYGTMDEPSVGSTRPSRSGETFNGSGRESSGSGARPSGSASQARPRKPVSASAAITLNHTASMSSDTAMATSNYTNGHAGAGDLLPSWFAPEQLTAALGQAMDDRLLAIVQSIGDIRGKLDALSLPGLATRVPGRDLLAENAQLLEANELLKEEVAHWKAEAQVAYDHHQTVAADLASLRQDLRSLVQHLALPGWQPSRPESLETLPSTTALRTSADPPPPPTQGKDLVTSPAEPSVAKILPSDSSDPPASTEVAEDAIDAYIRGLVEASEQVHRQAAGVLS